jgi:DNA-binding transcriptional LysR family regulator
MKRPTEPVRQPNPRGSRFDLNLVRVLVAIYETRSVTRAAERLDLTQSTVSHALARLREAYGDRLFGRIPQGLMPSPLCDELYERLSGALAGIEGSLGEAEHFHPASTTRSFRFAMSDIGVLFFVPPLLRRFQAVAPNLHVDIVSTSGADAEDLASGRLDLGIGTLPGLAAATRTRLLFNDRYVCLMSARHPLIGKSITLDQFATARHLMVDSPSSGHLLVEQLLASHGVARRIVARIPQFTVLPQLLVDSDLLVILPLRVARLFAANGRLKHVDLPIAMPSFEVRMHWHPRHEAVAAHRWVRDEVFGTLSVL